MSGDPFLTRVMTIFIKTYIFVKVREGKEGRKEGGKGGREEGRKGGMWSFGCKKTFDTMVGRCMPNSGHGGPPGTRVMTICVCVLCQPSNS